LYAWTITFTHQRYEAVQGAGNLPPLIVSDKSLSPASSAKVEVFEMIDGTHPLNINIGGLVSGSTLNTRVTAYNRRGLSLSAATASVLVTGQPDKVSAVSSRISSGTSLEVSWDTANNPTTDSYSVEVFTADPTQEVQVVTTSSSASLAEIQRVTVSSDTNNMAGYFKLQYMGQMTENIRWDATLKALILSLWLWLAYRLWALSQFPECPLASQ